MWCGINVVAVSCNILVEPLQQLARGCSGRLSVVGRLDGSSFGFGCRTVSFVYVCCDSISPTLEWLFFSVVVPWSACQYDVSHGHPAVIVVLCLPTLCMLSTSWLPRRPKQRESGRSTIWWASSLLLRWNAMILTSVDRTTVSLP